MNTVSATGAKGAYTATLSAVEQCKGYRVFRFNRADITGHHMLADLGWNGIHIHEGCVPARRAERNVALCAAHDGDVEHVCTTTATCECCATTLSDLLADHFA